MLIQTPGGFDQPDDQSHSAPQSDPWSEPMNEQSNGAQLNPHWRAPGTGPTLDVLGVAHTYKAMGNETGHQFSVWESIVPSGAGAPAHTHTREDEAFYVLSGERQFELEGATGPLHLGAGAFLFAPRNRWHAYRNSGPAPARLLVFAIPGTGLERMFAAFNAAGTGRAGLPSSDTLAAIAEQYGVVMRPMAATGASTSPEISD
jgi:quercetin dioxygenase-like cupin family protein